MSTQDSNDVVFLISHARKVMQKFPFKATFVCPKYSYNYTNIFLLFMYQFDTYKTWNIRDADWSKHSETVYVGIDLTNLWAKKVQD
jgi:hypothetical protein